MTLHVPRSLRLSLYIAFASAVVGCNNRDQPSAEPPSISAQRPTTSLDGLPPGAVTEVARDAATPPAAAKLQTTANGPAPADAAGSNGAASAVAEPDDSTQPDVAAKPFDPPYPGRTDLFAPPKKPDLETIARSGGRTNSSLALKGFVNVDGPKAILLIEGQLATLAVGDERFGVQVVSIAPPQITLQRGRERWTESLLQPGR